MTKDVLVPPLGQTTAEVTLVHWYKREGDAVQAGEPLYAIETDKAVLDIEAPASGVLRNVAAADGDKVAVLSAIAIIDNASGAAAPAPESPTQVAVAPPAPAPLAQPATVPTVSATPVAPMVAPASARVVEREGAVWKSGAPATRFISPRARRLAADERLDWSALVGTGPEGAVVERDIRAALAGAPASASSILGAQQAAPLRRGEQPVAPVSTATLIAEADFTELLRAQQQLTRYNSASTLADLLARVVARAQAASPQMDVGLIAVGMDIEANKSATLGVGPIQTRPAIVAGQVVARPLAWLTLTFDANLGEPAARFLDDVTRLIEQPALLLA